MNSLTGRGTNRDTWKASLTELKQFKLGKGPLMDRVWPVSHNLVDFRIRQLEDALKREG